ncbi:MAG: LapD/MoxY N-terminal periplasmic domain-containing protein [Campylobacterota bacterium]|nr:LapD/MoxY N-terminal periplasmic domain-containing protein [Campylobacterota bacterium]
MTLFKQIALMLSTFLIIILATVLILNFQNENSSVQDRLYKDAKNTASSLGISMSTASGDISIMQTMINASFDGGYYRYISLNDTEEKIIYKKNLEEKPLNIPKWFIDAIKIEAPIASASISTGWSQVGTIYVQGDTRYAYKQLYTILQNLIISFSIITIIGLMVLNTLLVVILRPLKEVQIQAEAITKNEFIIQEHIPHTKEFKDVVIGMNTMVKKMKNIFDKANEELKHQKELEYIDNITKLKNRKYFIDKLPEYLKIEATSKGGQNIMIALSGVIEANEKIGHKEVNKLFVKIADIFHSSVIKNNNAIIARMNGTEFCILLPDCSDKECLEITKNIFNLVEKSIKEIRLNSAETFISLGICGYSHEENIAQLLSHSDDALAKAKFSNTNIYQEHSNNTTEVMGKEEWREIINKAITLNSFDFISFKAVDMKLKKVIHNRLSLILKVDEKNIYKYYQFMPAANQIGLAHSIYTNILEMMFKKPDETLKDSTCSIRLPYAYLEFKDTYKYMNELLNNYARNLPFKLIIEVPDAFAFEDSQQIKLYKELFEKHNIDMGIFEFIGESDDYYYLQELRPAYIKGDSNYFISANEHTLSALRFITDSVGISLIATDVKDKETLDKLQNKDIYMIQGSVTLSI